MERFIFNVKQDDLILAVRAANWLLARPEYKDSVVAYGPNGCEATFYVKRNKGSITVRYTQ